MSSLTFLTCVQVESFNNENVFIKYSKGLATATETQIISDEIVDGDKIIVGYVGQASKAKKSNGNRGGMMGGPGGGGPR